MSILLSLWSHSGLAGDQACCSPKVVTLKCGRQISYFEIGNPYGKPVFYFHGVPGSRWEPKLIEQEAYAAGVRLIALDRPGIGNSTYYSKRTICDWPNDVAQVADQLGVSKFGILAVSGGCSYGCACALKIPHRISHLALVSPYAPPNAPGVEVGITENQLRLINALPNVGKLVAAQMANKVCKKPQQVMENFSKDWVEVDRQLLFSNQQLFINNIRTAGCQGGKGIVKDILLLSNDWGFSLCSIKFSCISIWSGNVDPIATPSMPKYFRNQLPSHPPLVMGPGEGHATMIKNYATSILQKF